jgi:hypothetical protein
MTEAKARGGSDPPLTTSAAAGTGEVEAERTLGRAVAIGLPVCVIGGAVAAGAASSVGSALLVLAAGALLATVGFVWASLRTLSGDAPLAAPFEGLAGWRPESGDLAEQKIRVLRALKDLENEHALGRIDDADFATLIQGHREEAKRLMRAIDEQAAPARAEAERVARDYLAQHGIGGEGQLRGATAPGPATPVGRVVCTACGASNEADATFCKQCAAPVKAGTGSPDA